MNAVRKLLSAMEQIYEEHPELEDSAVGEEIYAAIFNGFMERTPGYSIPDEFRMEDEDGNRRVKAALSRFIEKANLEADQLGLGTPERRFSVFHNDESVSENGGLDFFLGTPESYVMARSVFQNWGCES